MDEKDDALTVARWCWRNNQWKIVEVACVSWTVRHDKTFEEFNSVSYDRVWREYDGFTALGIADAEQVVLARGLAEQYGRALTAIVTPGATEYPGGRTSSLSVNYAMVAQLATAPLASRLRALARVARENPEAKT